MTYDCFSERGAGEFWGTDEAVAQRERGRHSQLGIFQNR
jgi:hypothetical protein